ncbi:hypothetical protein Lsai_1294 [Legionella sainthelensi]|uniref:Uncharacterized protein n=1 Tax=Legionella sainthelensi TaxID=28087 RepID=A0A0W0YPQ8_9GAMM|nr:hypothetical protein Lsai_1294 [Legionella sainthelensi]VEH36132.1 Uncharacterised protein [Legionella sainthelensi]
MILKQGIAKDILSKYYQGCKNLFHEMQQCTNEQGQFERLATLDKTWWGALCNNSMSVSCFLLKCDISTTLRM